MNVSNDNLKVFISYSQDSIDFADKIFNFSNRLRGEGIDAILDQYEESPPEGWPRWMENSINAAKYVIVVCTKGYQQKILGQVEAGKGRGAKWEGNIIYLKMYMNDTINSKFLPVIFSQTDIEFIPTPIQGSTYYDVSSEKGFDALYWRLRGVNAKQKPPLWKLRPLPEKERKTLFVTSMIDIGTWDKAIWRGAGFIIGYTPIPTLLLPFVQEKYAIKIFTDWIANVGRDDKNDDIRVALIEGDVLGEETGYYIVIGSNLDEAAKRAEKQNIPLDEMLMLNFTRIIRANPTDNFECFNIFKAEYFKSKEYNLMPAVLDGKTNQIKPIPQFSIHKRKLIYRDIKDIDEHDEDAIVIAKAMPWREYKK